MSRDARTVRPGEPVTLHEGNYITRRGTFIGIVSNYGTEYLRVTISDGAYDILPASDMFWLTDLNEHVLTIPEPVLETIPPELE